jgi:hypothetical protein
MVTPMDPALRQEIADACREHDRLMAEAADYEPVPAPPVRKDAGGGLHYLEHEENALAPLAAGGAPSSVMDAESSALWNRWIDLRLETERTEVLAIVSEALVAFGLGYTQEKIAPLGREVAGLKAELIECKGLLGTTLTMLDDVRATAEALQQERQIEVRERQVRDEIVRERSARVSELQRQNADARREADRSQLEAALTEYRARVERVETQLGMLLRFIGGDLPRGFGA